MLELDHKLLDFINRDLTNPVFDIFFPFWTDIQKSPFFFVLVLTLLILLSLKRKWRPVIILVLCAVGTFAADKINGKIIKYIFERPRPTDVILRTAAHGTYSFPSGHAVNVFFMSTFLSLFFPKYRIPLFIIAILTSFSRVYCGVHYPGDILAGGLIGMLFGFIFYQLVKKVMDRI